MHPTSCNANGTNDFFTYGVSGLELARSAERRAHDLCERPQSLRPASLLPTRRWLGSRMIGLGRHVAGIPAPATAAGK